MVYIIPPFPFSSLILPSLLRQRPNRSNRLRLPDLRLLQLPLMRMLSILLRKQKHLCIMCLNLAPPRSVPSPNRLSSPRVREFILTGLSETGNFREGEGFSGGDVLGVEHEDGDTLGALARVELGGVGEVVGPWRVKAPFEREDGGAIDGVLVKVDEEFVFEDGEVFGLDEVERGADEEGRFEAGPEGKVGAGLGVGEVAVADFKHVPVGVGVVVGVLGEEGGVVDDGHEAPAPVLLAGPLRDDVAPHAEAVGTGLGGPALGVGVAPVAEGVVDFAAG